MDKLIGLAGIVAVLGAAYLLSNNRKKINWRLVGVGLGIQFLLALFILKVPGTSDLFALLGNGITHLLDYALDGAAFVFGDQLAKGPVFIFAVRVSASIILATTITGMLYYFGLLQPVVKVMARLLQKSLGISGPEALSTVSAVFVGQVECQTVIRPYIPKLTNSQLFTVISAAMATISGSALVAYTGLGMNATWLLAASFMSAAGGIVTSKIMFPETEHETLDKQVDMQVEKVGENFFDALAHSSMTGARIAGYVMVQVLAFVALVAMVNGMLGGVLSHIGLSWQVQDILGVAFTPIAWLLGTPWHEAFHVGRLMATEILVNEFMAYNELSGVIHGTGAYVLSAKAQLVATMALCGFANLGSIAINIGGLSAMAPERRADIAKLAFKALIAANFATWITAAMAGLLF
jgi:CNT family concentrative nucleoside transporter